MEMERVPVRTVPEPIIPEFRSQLSELYSARSLVGSMPPKPASVRGRFGAVLVSVVRRMLFWFFPQLDRFHASLISVAELQAKALEKTGADLRKSITSERKALEQIQNRLGILEDAVQSLRTDVELVVRGSEEKQLAKAQAELWLETVTWRARLEGISEELGDIRRAQEKADAELVQQTERSSKLSVRAANG